MSDRHIKRLLKQMGLSTRPKPCIVVYEITRKHFIVADPAIGQRTLSHAEFKVIAGEVSSLSLSTRNSYSIATKEFVISFKASNHQTEIEHDLISAQPYSPEGYHG
ncbi:hypothetical protein [Scytonema sp. UIC 10036]|uniref:hypothetical protein n=1 Tax=Scytonema sp. UIC 10036 TaxID=2304196 RepID=UPI001FAABF34|nr:hypothetical protein [Scytonema sp. UIC 10036]